MLYDFRWSQLSKGKRSSISISSSCEVNFAQLHTQRPSIKTSLYKVEQSQQQHEVPDKAQFTTMKFTHQLHGLILTVSTILFSLGGVTASKKANDVVEKVYQFPGPPNPFLENLLVLDDDKETLILTDVVLPNLHILPAHASNISHRTIPLPEPGEFSLGIVEMAPGEIYFLAAANLSFEDLTVAKNSTRLYQLHLPDYSITKVHDLPEVTFLNGLAPLNDHVLLAADSRLGAVWSINLRTKDVKIAVQDPLMVPTNPNGTSLLGADGLKVLQPCTNRSSEPAQLLFSNENTRILGAVPMSSSGIPLGAARVLARAEQPNPPTGQEVFYDDFAVSHDRKSIYSSTGYGNSLVSIDVKTGEQKNLTSGTELPLWVTTSAALSKKKEGVVYGITTGGQPGKGVKEQVGSMVFKVTLPLGSK